jgi:hypothetical protein
MITERSEVMFQKLIPSYIHAFPISMIEDLRKIISQHGLQSVHDVLNKEMYHTYLYLQNIFSQDISCIYGIFNKTSDVCIYIGCSIDFTNRINWHYQEYCLFPNRKLYKIIKESGGWDHYIFKIIENLTDHRHLYDRERFWIKHYRPNGNTLHHPSGTFS